ncbi:hypothetical protein D9615_009872 [Tricholomella constricta]|uniref:Uncharacterized protein n=1 Tax=Tricholomella constricta TaxID=117010 RepID=A0A8H5GXC2_9AGAR|nr:hypothetical protein D9615_009872 [Tricholomella constricta]
MRFFASLLAIALPLASAVTIQPPASPHVGATIDVNWVNRPGDPPSWNLFLMNISTSFDLKANFGVIDPTPQTVKMTLPGTLRPRQVLSVYVRQFVCLLDDTATIMFYMPPMCLGARVDMNNKGNGEDELPPKCRDLRLPDNPVFHKTTLDTLMCSPCISSRLPKSKSQALCNPGCGRHRRGIVGSLKSGLEALGSGLMMRVGHMGEVVRGVLEGGDEGFRKKVAGVGITMDWASEELEQMRDIRAIVDEAGKGNVEWKVWDGEEMLIHDDLSLFVIPFGRHYPVLRAFSSPTLDASSTSLIPDSLDELIDTLQRPLAGSDLASIIPHPIGGKSAHPSTSGETQAQIRVQHLLSSGAMSTYKDTRNGLLGESFSSKFSGYLSHGFITARQIHAWMSAFEDAAADGVPPEWRSLDKSSGYGHGENKGTAAVRFELL